MELKVRGRNWASDIASIRKWKAFNPTSPGAAIAEAIYWRRYAWNVVGGEYNTGADPFALQLFKKRLNAADQVLIDSKSYASNNPLWYQLYILISSDSGKGDAALEDIFKEAVGRHPHFLDIYSEMANHWSPRHGKADWKKVDDIIRLAMFNTKKTEGTSGYAVLYDAVKTNQRME